MILTETDIAGVMIIDVERLMDDRGFFARGFCAEEFTAHGLRGDFVQTNIAHNARRGTLRGMHYQAEPAPEPKVVRCTRGAIYDVAVDLRPASPSYCQWVGAELSADNHRALYIPAGCAHGLLTLEDHSEVYYIMAAAYVPDLARGVRWNDPAFAIHWPFEPSTISERDAALADFIR